MHTSETIELNVGNIEYTVKGSVSGVAEYRHLTAIIEEFNQRAKELAGVLETILSPNGSRALIAQTDETGRGFGVVTLDFAFNVYGPDTFLNKRTANRLLYEIVIDPTVDFVMQYAASIVGTKQFIMMVDRQADGPFISDPYRYVRPSLPSRPPAYGALSVWRMVKTWLGIR